MDNEQVSIREVMTMLQTMSNSIFSLEQKIDSVKDDLHQIEIKVEKSIAEGESEHKYSRETLDHLRGSISKKVEENTQDIRDAKAGVKTLKGLLSLLVSIGVVLGAIGAFLMLFK